MKNNRFISFASAMAMVLSSMSGLSAVNVFAADAPEYGDWSFSDPAYIEDFGESTATELADKGWTLSRPDGNSFTMRTNPNAVSFNYDRGLKYSQTDENKVYYYTYKIRMYNETAESQVVRLVGAENHTVVSAPDACGSTYTYTTVVDTENNKSYTYSNGELKADTDLAGDSVTGIEFKNTANSKEYSFYLYEFSYGAAVLDQADPTATATAEADTEAPTATAAPAEKPEDGLSYWTLPAANYTEDFEKESTDELTAWSFNDNAKHRSIRTVEDNKVLALTWLGTATYSGAPKSGSYYYTYKIRMYGNDGQQTVRLEGITDGDIVIAPEAKGDYYSYTTVIDADNNKVYVYNGDNTLKSTVVIPENETVTGITFACLENVDKAIWIDDFSYGVIKEGEVQPTATATAEAATEAPTATATVEATTEAPTATATAEADTEAPTATATAEATMEAPTATATAEATTEAPTATATAEATTEAPTATATAEATTEAPTATVSPAEKPEDGLSYWTLPAAKYTEDFTQWIDNKQGLPEYTGTWSLYNGDRANNAYLMVRTNSTNEPVLALMWHGKASYDTAPKSGVYYYTYKINMWNKNNANNVVYLNGIENGKIIESPLADTDEHIFTTVIDADNGKAYTYNEDGTLIKMTELPADRHVMGITFECLDESSAVWINEFSYGIIAEGADETTEAPTVTPTQLPDVTPTPIPTSTPITADTALSDWTLDTASYTESFTDATIASLTAGDWAFGNTNTGSFNPSHATIDGNERLSIQWYGSATYPVVSKSGSYYYTYKVRMTASNGDQVVHIDGLTDGDVLVSPLASGSEYYTFTTIVDIYSKKVYTYNAESGELVSIKAIQDKESVSGITFASYNNSRNSMYIEDFSYGTVTVELVPPVQIDVVSEQLNNGEPLETGKDYTVTAESFTDTVIEFGEPVSKLENGKVPLYAVTTLQITTADGSEFPSGINVSGNKLTAAAALAEGTYNINVVAKSDSILGTLFTQTYNIKLVKNAVTPEEIMNDYIPVIMSDGEKVTENQLIYNNLELPQSNSIMTLTWSSDKPEVISNSGAVTRPLEDTEVTLTAKITSVEDPSKSKECSVKVTVKGVGAMLNDAIAEAEAALVSADDETKLMDAAKLADLHEDVKLHTAYTNKKYDEYANVVYTWSSDNDALKINDGLAQIYPTEVKKYDVKLTLKASFGTTAVIKTIPVTINLTPENAADKYAVRCDDAAEANFKRLADIADTVVSSDITLPEKGIFGSVISWTTSAPMYISGTGKYQAPANTISATLTGVVSKGKLMSDTKHAYSFKVKGKNSSSSGSSGGGGGSSPSKSSTFSVPMTTPTTPAATASPQINNNTLPQTVKGFIDLGDTAWAAEAINVLADKGIVSGRSDNIFAPNDNVTRAEFAKIIVNAFGFADEDAETDVFTDVKKGDWYYSYIAAAYANGIINGYEDGRFGVNDKITRQDMAVIIYRAAQKAEIALDDINDEIVFDDTQSISDYAKDAVTALQKAGIINGISDTEFAPTANATRAQAAKMTYELIK